jgi:hypothetical protein
MDRQELIKKITEKKEFSQLPKEDVELALEKFERKNLNDYQKMKLTRQFLRKVFSSFSSRKVFSSKEKEAEWYLLKHKSTKERYSCYKEVYSRCLKGFKTASIIDLGAGINGLSYGFFSSAGFKINYTAAEGIGQFVELMNNFFEKNKLTNKAKAYHLSLFNLERVKEIIEKQRKPRVIFLFKVIDSLEIVKRDYSKELLFGISNLSDRVVVSFATKSLGSRKKFSAQRTWFLRFVEQNFEILDDFEINGERYLSFKNKN